MHAVRLQMGYVSIELPTRRSPTTTVSGTIGKTRVYNCTSLVCIIKLNGAGSAFDDVGYVGLIAHSLHKFVVIWRMK